MTQANIRMDEQVKSQADPFYSASNMMELTRRSKDFDSGSAELIIKSIEDLKAMENE